MPLVDRGVARLPVALLTHWKSYLLVLLALIGDDVARLSASCTTKTPASIRSARPTLSCSWQCRPKCKSCYRNEIVPAPEEPIASDHFDKEIYFDMVRESLLVAALPSSK